LSANRRCGENAEGRVAKRELRGKAPNIGGGKCRGKAGKGQKKR